jgi:N-acetylmuramoyl-L-alanine amidase
MRNRGDASLIESPRFRERIARSIAAGLARFLSTC